MFGEKWVVRRRSEKRKGLPTAGMAADGGFDAYVLDPVSSVGLQTILSWNF